MTNNPGFEQGSTSHGLLGNLKRRATADVKGEYRTATPLTRHPACLTTALLPNLRMRHQLHTDSLASRKLDAINDAVRSSDASRLSILGASPFGFVNRAMRQKAWSLLLLGCYSMDSEGDILRDALGPGSNRRRDSSKQKSSKAKHQQTSTEETMHQIGLDVPRSFTHFGWDTLSTPTTDTNQSVSLIFSTEIPVDPPPNKDLLRASLDTLLRSVFMSNPHLRYYQGFHDVCSLLILTYGPSHPHLPALATALANSHLRDFMTPTLSGLLSFSHLLLPLLETSSPVLYKHLVSFSPTPSITSIPLTPTLSWLLTLLVHDTSNLEILQRIWDFYLSSHPISSLYLITAILLSHQPQLLALSDETDIFQYIKAVPKSFNLDFIDARIQDSVMLRKKYPQDRFTTSFPPSSMIQSYPNLRARLSDPFDNDPYTDCHDLFDAFCGELERCGGDVGGAEKIREDARGSIFIAVAVGVISLGLWYQGYVNFMTTGLI